MLHIYVDRDSEQGNVYVKCPSIAAAISAVNTLHGRFYAGQWQILLRLLFVLIVNTKMCHEITSIIFLHNIYKYSFD